MRKLLGAGLAALIESAALAQAPAPPKLLIVISVDQFSADLFDEYLPHFTAGLARIANGPVFRNGYQSHAATETCPGHSTILTGNRPTHTGIVMNTWIDQSAARPEKEIYCAEDESVSPPLGNGATYTVSPVHLKVQTLGELMKARWPGSRNVAVAGKDRAAIMMGGHTPDQRWFYRGGQFVTDLAGAAVPASLPRFNAALAASLSQPRLPLDPPALCAAKSQQFTLPGGKVVGNGRFARAANDRSAFTDSPEFDGAVLALAALLVQEMQLGHRPAPDVLALGLSATDYVGHTFGTKGQEMCLQLLDLDRELGDFFSMLDRGGVDYAVALTADHGGLDIPARVSGGSYVDPSIGAEQLGKKIGSDLKLSGTVLLGDYAGDIFIDRNLSPANRERVRAAALAAYGSSGQVEQLFTREQVAATPMPTSPPDRWSLIERARASYDPLRSGDLIVILKPNIAPYPPSQGIASTHGTPWDYDRRVPILFWRRGFSGARHEEAVETVDIMPTLAGMIGLPLDRSKIDGTCLAAAPTVTCPAR